MAPYRTNRGSKIPRNKSWTVTNLPSLKHPSETNKIYRTLLEKKLITYPDKGRTNYSEFCIALWVCLKEEIAKKGHKWRRKKCSFTKKIHYVTSWLQRWQNNMNCTLNWFHIHPILQIWPPATAGCLQTSNKCSRKEIWLQWRSDIGSWGVFWDQRLIVLLKMASNW